MRLSRLWPKTWMIAAVATGICGNFAVQAYGSIAAPDEPATAGPIRPVYRAPEVARTAKPSGDALVARNVFCSDCTPAVASGPAAPGETFAPDATLIATSVDDAAHSRATLRVNASQSQGSWGLGDAIAELGTITRIGYTSIDITDDKGRIGKISLLEQQAKKAAADAATSAAAAAPENPFADQVNKVADNQYAVKRSLVAELVNGASTGKGGIRATPVMKDGAMNGIRMLAVKGNSAPAAIGLKSGDVIESIAGTPIKSAQEMIDLYGKLDRLDTVELVGTRAGKPLSIRLDLK